MTVLGDVETILK